MLLTIYPEVPRIIFGVSAWALCELTMRPREYDEGNEQTMLRRALRLGMICCTTLHLLAMLAILFIPCPPERLDKNGLPSSSLTLHLEYLCQHMLRSIGILCLNAGLFIISKMETPNAMAMQGVIHAYVVLRTVGVILFHLGTNVNLAMKVVSLETFLAIEAVIAGVVFIVLSVKFSRMRSRLQESGIAGESLVESMLFLAMELSAILAGGFLMDVLQRIGTIVALINPSPELMAVIKGIIDLFRVVDHALFTCVIITFLFMNVPTEDLERVGVEFRSLHCNDNMRAV